MKPEKAKDYRAIFEYAYDAIVICGLETGKIIDANPEAESILGHKRSDLKGRKLCRFLPSGVYEKYRGKLQAEGFLYVEEEKVDITKSSSRYVSMSISVINYRGKRAGLFIIKNITDRKKMERKLRERAENLEELIHVISHDLKEPLRTIGSYCDLLKIGGKRRLSKKDLARLNKLKEASRRMHALLSDLNDLSRITQSGPAEMINLSNLIHKIEDEINPGEKEELIFEADLPNIKFNPFNLKTLLQNIISNGFQHNSPPKKVEVEITATDGRPEILVRDNGRGIPEKYREKIFQMFLQLDPDKHEEGTGAGLAFCKRIVDHCGGEIELTSNVGEGTTFQLLLPKWAAYGGENES